MKIFTALRNLIHKAARKALSMLPRRRRFGIYRSFVECDPAPNTRLVLKIAETREELEACLSLLHDSYVDSGFMTPDPSGMRVTIYHSLPTTTTLCAKYDDKVVGTVSLIRESALGFPLQRIFDLSGVRARKGNIAEVSALAVHPRFRRTGGSILFPLMKFMYEYCTTFFDTRHLLIAVNPRHIELYESLLFFKRLSATVVDNYDFVNGAPAVGATLDLKRAPEVFRQLSAIIRLGKDEVSRLQVQAVPDSERKGEGLFGFRIGEPDLIWRKFVTALYRGQTHSDLDQATRFLT
jgi:GNAT superfamily N-acetyltransferase